MRIALSIAGSDSGGGAGLQADLKAFQRFGVFGTSVVTAVTAQNTRGVAAVHVVPEDVVSAQIEALATDLPPAALKTGMLATAGIVRRVAAAIAAHRWRAYVLDPVMVATSGDRLLDREAAGELAARLVPLAALVTPNLAEAQVLAGFPVRDRADMARAGRRILELGARAVLIKGGHLDAGLLSDLLMTPESETAFDHPRLATRSTHGTGCALSAAITAGLALGAPLTEAVARAIDYVQRAIAGAPGLGAGNGPIDLGA